MTPTQALTPQALMELADDYARCAATAHVESLYGGSKSYTAECQKHENEARSKLSAALSAAPAGEPVAPTDEALARVAHKGYDDYWAEDSPGRETEAWAASAKAVLATFAAPVPAEPVLPLCKVAAILHRWDSAAQQHIPTLVIEFEPVPANSPITAKGWTDRDRLAAMLAAAPASPKG